MQQKEGQQENRNPKKVLGYARSSLKRDPKRCRRFLDEYAGIVCSGAKDLGYFRLYFKILDLNKKGDYEKAEELLRELAQLGELRLTYKYRTALKRYDRSCGNPKIRTSSFWYRIGELSPADPVAARVAH